MMKLKNIDIKKFFLNIILPTLLAEGLFILLIFVLIVPYFQYHLIEAKKEMIKEIINSSFSIAQENLNKVKSGELTEDSAKYAAISTIQNIRYGMANKDYIWITDETPVMIMHPYKKELIGKNVENFTDPNGKRMFLEMVKKVKESGEGYVDYQWQWMDDSTRIVPKISFIKEFKQWNWILGTGVYIEDVRNSIDNIINYLIWISSGIILISSFLLILIVRQNYKIDQKRSLAEKNLKESNEKYKALVEASKDGTLMFINDYCVFKNNIISELIGNEIFNHLKPNLELLVNPLFKDDLLKINSFLNSDTESLLLETQIRKKTNEYINTIITFSRIQLQDSSGLIVVIKDLSASEDESVTKFINSDIISNVSEKTNLGIFRAILGKRIRIIECNPQLLNMTGFASLSEVSSVNLLSLFYSVFEKQDFVFYLKQSGVVKDFICKIKKKDSSVIKVSVNAVVLPAKDNSVIFIDGFITDYDERNRENEEKDKILTELLSLNSIYDLKIQNFNLKDIPICPKNITVKTALDLMNFHSSPLLISSENTRLFITKNILQDLLCQEKVTLQSDIEYLLVKDEHLPDADISILKAIELIAENKNGYLIINSKGIKKFILLADLANLIMGNSKFLSEKIRDSKSLEELKLIHKQLPVYIQSLIKTGIDVNIVSGIVTNVNDEISKVIIDKAISQCGEPPCKFAFVVLGSEGRKEQVLTTDQDNALIFEDIPEEKLISVKKYFSTFAEMINNNLHKVGYKLCIGDIMAKNERWNQPLHKWKEYFDKWISVPEQQNLIDSSVFFDFRCIYGDRHLTEQLREYVSKNISASSHYLNQMALMTINTKLPVGFLGKIHTEIKEEHAGNFNIKNSIRLLVNITRLFAMKHSIEQTNTLLRLENLSAFSHIQPEFFKEMVHCYKYLMSVQFNYQAKLITKGIAPDYYLDLTVLTELELNNLKNILNKLPMFQTHIKHEFGINI